MGYKTVWRHSYDISFSGKKIEIKNSLYFLVQFGKGCSLTHWGRVTHICVSDLTSIGSDNGLSSGRRQAIIRNNADNGLARTRRQAIIWTNAGILLIRPLGTNFSEFLVEILIFSFKKLRLKVSSVKRRPFCLGLNDLTLWVRAIHICISEQDHHWFRYWYDAKPCSEPMMTCCQLDHREQASMKFLLKIKLFHWWKCVSKYCLQNGGHFVSASLCRCHGEIDDSASLSEGQQLYCTWAQW